MGPFAKPPAPWRQTAILGGALLAGVVILIGLLAFNRQAPPPAPLTSELAHLKMLALALKLHADEHEGKFPASVADIHWRQSLPGMRWDGLPAAVSRFHDPDSGKLMDWIYYQGHTEADSPETILLASPVPVGRGKNQRLVARLDSVAELLTEGAFQKAVAAQPAAR